MSLSSLQEGTRIAGLATVNQDQVPVDVIAIPAERLAQVLELAPKEAEILYQYAESLYRAARLLEDLAILRQQQAARDRAIQTLQLFREHLLTSVRTAEVLTYSFLQEESERILTELIAEVKLTVPDLTVVPEEAVTD
jgi:hypothetical protein